MRRRNTCYSYWHKGATHFDSPETSEYFLEGILDGRLVVIHMPFAEMEWPNVIESYLLNSIDAVWPRF